MRTLGAITFLTLDDVMLAPGSRPPDPERERRAKIVREAEGQDPQLR